MSFPCLRRTVRKFVDTRVTLGLCLWHEFPVLSALSSAERKSLAFGQWLGGFGKRSLPTLENERTTVHVFLVFGLLLDMLLGSAWLSGRWSYQAQKGRAEWAALKFLTLMPCSGKNGRHCTSLVSEICIARAQFYCCYSHSAFSHGSMVVGEEFATLRTNEYYAEIRKYYQAKKDEPDYEQKLSNLQQDSELQSVFVSVKNSGDDELKRLKSDITAQRTFSRKFGAIPQDLADSLKTISAQPVNLFEATLKGDAKAVGQFCQMKSPVQSYDEHGVTPLGYATAKGNEEVVKLLVEAKANIFNVDLKENTALHYAAGYGHESLTKFFLEQGCEKSDTNVDSQTPADVAKLNGKTVTANLVS
eukprot:726085-Amphidinium_carterae.1